MATTESPNPKVVSSDYRAMQPYWQMVSDILKGVEALRSTSGGDYASPAVPGPAIPYENLSQLGVSRHGKGSGNQSPYLPQFPNELNLDYQIRRENAPLTNIYKDVSENLAGKPFSKTCELAADTPQDLKDWSENVDGQGNNLHVFASHVFKSGIDKGIDWILVDYVKASGIRTLADERAIGAKPYWVHVAAENLLAVYSDFVNGQEVITHARIYEMSTRRDGFKEDTVEHVREFTREAVADANGKVLGYQPATWNLWELVEETDSSGKEDRNWRVIESGPISIGIIPLIPFKTSARDGCSWRVDPPLKDLAFMQVEEFQQESNKRAIKEMTAFPMLSGDGVARPTDNKGAPVQVSVGPKVILFTGHGGEGTRPGSFRYVEPSGSSLTFLKQDLEGFRDEMRNLGKQPLASANLTVITTANISMRAHSAVQAWALLLKDALEQAMLVTCKWMGRTDEPEVNVHTDFGVDFEAGTELDGLLKAEAAGIVSKETVAEEFKRRGILSDDFDYEDEKKRLAEQGAKLAGEQQIDPRTGKPLKPVANGNLNGGQQPDNKPPQQGHNVKINITANTPAVQ